MADEHPAKPFYSVLVLAFVCSALVAGAAVGLRPMQEANKQLDQKKHILYAAGLYEENADIAQLFSQVKIKVVDLETGEFVGPETVSPQGYKQSKAAFTNELGKALDSGDDIAKLSRVEKYSLVYLIGETNNIKEVILPIRGKGLWSTMYAYVALESDLSTIKGVSFYEHGETPGLGGEIENVRWQSGWQGKKIYAKDGQVELNFAKGKSTLRDDAALYEIDGLSGATLTTKGVDNLMKFWFGPHGFQTFLSKLRKGEQANG